MKTLFNSMCLLLLISSTYGQVSQIDKKDLKDIVKTLSSRSYQGRGLLSEGGEKTQNFISESFAQSGLLTYANDSYLEKFSLKLVYWDETYMDTSDGRLNNFDQFVIMGGNPINDVVEKELVFGGWGSDEELDQIDLRDKVVLVFMKNLRADYDLMKKLAKRKAFAMMAVNPNNEKQFGSIKRTYKNHVLSKRFTLAEKNKDRKIFSQFDTIKTINRILIPNDRVRKLCGQPIGALKALAQSNKLRDFQSVKVKLKYQKIEEEVETANVIGMINGRSEKTIVVTAHYDHLEKADDHFYPGADDNATGVAALLELAGYFSNKTDLNYNVMFMATGAEEKGLLGSYYHVNHPEFDSSSILCNLNLDMIGRADEKHEKGDYLYCLGTTEFEMLDQIVQQADQMYPACQLDYSINDIGKLFGLYGRSDQYNFYRKGIPSYMFFSGLHDDYHQVTDTADKINYKNLEKRVTQIAVIIEQIQRSGNEY
ncbi:MAG: M28 family peptidase [Bacteroidota bacterium]